MKNQPPLTKESGRYFLTDLIREEVNFRLTEQNRGCEPPPVEKPFSPESRVIALPPQGSWKIPPCELQAAIANRQSHRRFTRESLSLQELAFLLWATQGVRHVVHAAAVLRTVPSAGCRHPFETYLAVMRVDGVLPGLYRYLPLEHALLDMGDRCNLPSKLMTATHGQSFSGQAAVTFLWTVIPARTEWRYGEASYKVIALDAGHLCQNLYLACEAVSSGTCAVAAYNQLLADELLGVDGQEEFCIYIAPVGKVARHG